MQVEFYRHSLGPTDAAAIAAVLASPFLTTGEVSKRVEGQLATYFNVPHALLTNSWTNGAIAALLALRLGPGDEVIVPAMTFVASANVVKLVGAQPVFADVDPSTLLLTPEEVIRRITDRTKVVLPVHLYGQMCDMARLRKVVDAHFAPGRRIWLIEDAAHCFEGERDGCKPGAFSDAAIFSFYATKNVTCGEGGAIVTRDRALADAFRETRQHGMSAAAIDRFAAGCYNHWDVAQIGTKANLPDLLAALLPRQIDGVDASLARRQEIAARYSDAFAQGQLRLVETLRTAKHARHLFTIGIPHSMRDRAIGVLNAAGIAVTVNYRSVPDLTYYRTQCPEAGAACPIARQWGEETLSLPLYPSLSREAQDYVIRVVREQVYPMLA